MALVQSPAPAGPLCREPAESGPRRSTNLSCYELLNLSKHLNFQRVLGLSLWMLENRIPHHLARPFLRMCHVTPLHVCWVYNQRGG